VCEQAAGNANSVRQVDQSAAMDAVRKLESRLRAAEDEVSEFRLKVRYLSMSSSRLCFWRLASRSAML